MSLQEKVTFCCFKKITGFYLNLFISSERRHVSKEEFTLSISGYYIGPVHVQKKTVLAAETASFIATKPPRDETRSDYENNFSPLPLKYPVKTREERK